MTKNDYSTQATTLAKTSQNAAWYRPSPLALAVVVAGSATLLAGCNPGGGSGLGRASLDIQATAPSYSANTARSLAVRNTGDSVVLPVIDKNSTKAGDLTLNKAWIVIRSIELERDDDDDDDSDDDEDDDRDDDDDDDDEIEFVGPFVVNLLTNEVTPELPELNLPQGRYDDIEIEYGPLRSNDLGTDGERLMDQFPDVGSEYSVYLEGGYTSVDGTYSDIDFRFTYDDDDEFELSGLDPSHGFDVTGDVDLIVAFRMARWFRFDDDDTNDDGVEFEDGVTTVEGRNVVFLDDDDSYTENVFEVIEENIEESADYGNDDDDDGKLGSDEDDDDDDDWDDWDDDDDDDDDD